MAGNRFWNKTMIPICQCCNQKIYTRLRPDQKFCKKCNNKPQSMKMKKNITISGGNK
jgi:hypothetical protein